MGLPDNLLYYGDNLDVIRLHVKDESIDLIYLDPPFNSQQNYNVLFAERSGKKAAAQIKAFEDTWTWDETAAEAFESVVESGGEVANVMRAFRTALGDNDLLAYLSMMAPRLVELRRVLKPTGSIYLHCDPAASHYLKVLLDGVFGATQFRNEIVWKRTGSHNDARKFADIHDCLLYYAKGSRPTWSPQHAAHNERYLAAHYNRRDQSGRVYRLDNIIRSASMGPRPNLVYEYKSFTPEWGWRVERPKLEALDESGRIEWVKSGKPYLVRYLDEMRGAAMPSLWDDIPPINSQAKERLGYPTQKPEALLERIIAASSNEEDVVLDPFCGCGTAVAVAQRLNRRWVGIDITHLAISLIRRRLIDAFGDDIINAFRVIGEPTDLEGARQLAGEDPYQFQFWILGLVGARPAQEKKGSDKGIDGRIYFHDETGAGAKTKQVILSVKAGNLKPAFVSELRGVMEREAAEFGVLLTMNPPTKAMRAEAASGGFYTPAYNPEAKYPRLQIITVAELLDGRGIDYPGRGLGVTFKRAPKAATRVPEPSPLFAAEGAPPYGGKR